MLDFHSHILPCIDDGSKNVEESLSMLALLKEQGVDTVIATPHYYADRESPSQFLERRSASHELLKNVMPADTPRMLLGAEVRFYNGISRTAELTSLCIEGSKLLLLEMPFQKWTEYTLRELSELSCSSEYTVVLAHIDRYVGKQGRRVLGQLREQGVLMQMNSDYFNGFITRKKALRLLMEGFVNFIGSDCHNLTTRPPEIGEAYSIIKRRLGDAVYTEFTKDCRILLERYSV